jgi:hypothetical protein
MVFCTFLAVGNYEDGYSSGKTVLVTRFISLNVIMDLLYWLWKSKWTFYVSYCFALIFVKILCSCSSLCLQISSFILYPNIRHITISHVLTSYVRHAFLQLSIIWFMYRCILIYSILFISLNLYHEDCLTFVYIS